MLFATLWGLMKTKALFLPGLGAGELVWQEQLGLLEDSLDTGVLVLDRQKSRAEMASAAIESLSEPATLIGHSMGGWVAQEIAANCPDKIKSLILISTWSHPDPGAKLQLQTALMAAKSNQLEAMLWQHLQTIVHPARLSDASFMKKIVQAHTALQPQVLLQQIEAILSDFETSQLLGQIACPVLLVHGRQDALFSLNHMEETAKKVNQCEVAILEDCGHMPPMEKPEELASLIRGFIF